jgi:hypothetical protein
MERASKDRRAFTAAVWTRAPKAAFVMVPAFGLLTMALFRRRVRFFVPHFTSPCTFTPSRACWRCCS